MNFWVEAAPATLMLCSSQTGRSASCTSRSCQMIWTLFWPPLTSLHPSPSFCTCKAIVEERCKGNIAEGKKQPLFTPFHSRGPKLFVIPSHCHCSGKEPVSDSRSTSLGSSFYSSTRQKQRSRVSDLPIVEIKSLDPDPNICLQNHDSKPTGWSNFGLKLQGLSPSRGRNIPLVR